MFWGPGTRNLGTFDYSAASKSKLYSDHDFHRLVSIKELEGEENLPFALDLQRVVGCFAFRRMQHKTQLFPVHWNDFVRNRMTHVLEIAQIARTIANRTNARDPFFRQNPISLDLVEVAALCHDIGHPPFGHAGENVLNRCMQTSGGFEGNAQTLRLISKLERRELKSDWEPGTDEPYLDLDDDARVGLNLTMRSIASTLKYDRLIPRDVGRDGAKIVKGYYKEEEDIVKTVRECTFRGKSKSFPSLECDLMDKADDIGYALSDLEDCFRVGVLSPLDMLGADADLIEKVSEKASSAANTKLSPKDTQVVLRGLFATMAKFDKSITKSGLDNAATAAKASFQITRNTYHRSKIISGLRQKFINGIHIDANPRLPSTSKVRIDAEVEIAIEVLKSFNYFSVIRSSDIQIAQHRARVIIEGIFEALRGKDGLDLVTGTRRRHMERLTGQPLDRAICDYIADMTDSFASEYYSRLRSSSPRRTYHTI